MVSDDRAPDGADRERVTALVRQFTHDVASPLTLVLALSDLLQRHFPPEHEAHADLAQIQRSAREVLSMVRSLAVSLPGRQDAPESPKDL